MTRSFRPLVVCRSLCVRSLCVATVFLASPVSTDAQEENSPSRYRQLVLEDQPLAYWTFDAPTGPEFANAAAEGFGRATVQGPLKTGVAGPRRDEFPLFDDMNSAIEFTSGAVLRVEASPDETFQFQQGESITIEAWVAPQNLRGGGFGYIVAKGRTFLPGFSRENHNYALRLARQGDSAALSFLFRSADPDGDWHRWTSGSGFAIGDGWHHVAVTYTFGDGDSIRGYIDGEPVQGKWDMGGRTDRAPVVDADEVWIGSSMGVADGSTFAGQLDEVALYRHALTPERIATRFEYRGGLVETPREEIPRDRVLVEIYERLPDKASWKFRSPKYSESYQQPVLAFIDVPRKYNERGVHIDRSNPFLIRAWSRVRLPEGPLRLLIRSRNASRLFLDGAPLAETDFHRISSSAHGTVVPLDDSLGANTRAVRRGDTQQVVELMGDGAEHELRFEMIVGGRNHRPELGETAVAISVGDGPFTLISHGEPVSLTDDGWARFAREQQDWLTVWNAQRRRVLGAAEDTYWQRRHAMAAESLSASAVIDQSVVEAGTRIDEMLRDSWEAAGVEPSRPLTDLEFLRRVSVDLTGVVPSSELVTEFLEDKRPDRRTRLINRLLESSRWADNWVGYWQDVLAENPNIVNPTLNNTGPFRWWIHESFLENKPIDRFATELIRMEGSQLYGGPGGFALATQNDVPMAAKAHIIGQAFLGLEMKCARCHDAPFHDFRQEDLFSLAAMLKRSPQEVPASSTIPGGEDAVASLIVEVNLKPGQKVAPRWTFEELADPTFPSEWIRDPADTREQLAWLVTNPGNRRFAEVIVNRLWKRYLGYGLVEPADDWDSGEASHPALLSYLADQLIASGYDLKHLARVILNSPTYQRVPVSRDSISDRQPWHFAAPVRRKLEAEQLVDSLFAIAGMPFDAGPMCIDIDGARSPSSSLNLGEATTAWHFSSLSNERDRPSLALPFAQPFVNMLETFGWRSSRQDPVTERSLESTVQQPAAMNNSLLVQRIARLSDRNGLTRLAVAADSPEQLVNQLFIRILSREPTADERQWFVELIEPGFAARVIPDARPVEPPVLRRGLVSWSNHLHPEANRIKNELERAVRAGDPPTNRLNAEWRQRVEDGIWVLLNSPEFLFLP